MLHFLLGPYDFLNNVNADCNFQGEKINTGCMRREISDHRNVIFSYRIVFVTGMWALDNYNRSQVCCPIHLS
jgi:hypothetical protein